ncbi:MAG: hypothetical protein GON13_01435 [Nanoarchaeota archaeon]|nr:hypothetical protein [Nanoarchaeota archaeon]
MVNNFTLSDGANKLLNDVWSASSSRAVQALSQTLSKDAFVKSSKTKLSNMKEIPSLLNPNNSSITVVSIPIQNDLVGTIFLVFEQSSVLAFSDMLLKHEIGSAQQLDNQNMSVIRELGNTMAGFFVEGFIKLFDDKIILKKPKIGVNEYRILEGSALGNVYQYDIDVLLFETNFLIKGTGFSGRLLTVFDSVATSKIFEKILKNV